LEGITLNIDLRRCLPLLLLLPALFTQTGGAVEKIVKNTIVSQKQKRSYYLFVPEKVSASKPAPLIVLLHGSGRDGNSLVEKWRDLASAEGIILAGPDASNSSGWSFPADGPAFLHDLVEDLKTKYPVDPSRVYLFGHSAGAVFALFMSMMESEYFAATAIHAGGFRQPSEYEAIKDLKRKIPIAIWVGTRDPFFPLGSVRQTRDALAAQGVEIQLNEMPGHDHWYYDLASGINKKAWSFLASRQLSDAPQYTNYAFGVESVSGEINKNATEVNRLISEINTVTNTINDSVGRYNADELAISGKDFVKDRAEINRIIEDEVKILNEAVASTRYAAENADRAGTLSTGKYRNYFLLVAKQNRKTTEAFEVMLQVSEAILNSGSVEASNIKRAEARTRILQLQSEAEELGKQATAAMQ
jgi:predicted esterase